jgi:hypothetical protein
MLSKDLERIEREETMRQDADLRRRQQPAQGGTFFQHGLAQADEVNQGRFAATGVPTVTGSTPVPSYPAAGAHQSDPVGTEPPLGFSVNELEPSANHLPPVEETCAPAGAAAAAENLPLASAQPDDAGAPFSQQDEDQ